jgi:hypothetical protein
MTSLQRILLKIQSFNFILLSVMLVTATTIQAQTIRYPNTPTTSFFQPVDVNSNIQPRYNQPATAIPKQYQQQQLNEQQKQNNLIKEAVARNTKASKQKTITIDTAKYNSYKFSFEKALQQLKTLNASTTNPSLADAFYITENAFGTPYLTKSEYEKVLNKSAAFIKQWMLQNNYDKNDNEAKHLAIQKFMSEKLTIGETISSKDNGVTIRTSQHLPFFYDYNDYQGTQDHRNYFITKCLATGAGQCNSLPLLYLVLAEKINAKTYLSIAPQHSFIMYPKNNGEIENYEATSNWHINNLWYQENLNITPEAIASGIYLDTLSKNKIVANCMLELAFQYIKKMPIDDGEFLQKCLRESYSYFPQHNNIQAYFIYSEYLKGLLQLALAKKGITDIYKAQNDKYITDIQKEYQKNEAYIKQLGYKDMPPAMYEELLRQHQLKSNVQAQKKISGKQRRNLFIETK